jgi:hypothetical protein
MSEQTKDAAMDETGMASTSDSPSGATSRRARRTRVGRKRTCFKGWPRPAIPVRGLWEQATPEEKSKAHTACMAILEYWLGKASKAQIAQRLEVPPLRVWQLSQQALSGMLAGLLRQPKTRRKVSLPPATPEEDPTHLKRRIVDLEKKLARTEDLVRVLKDLPWARQAASPPTANGKGGPDARSKPIRVRRGAQASTRNASPRRPDPRRRSNAGRARGDQEDARGDPPHAAELGA